MIPILLAHLTNVDRRFCRMRFDYLTGPVLAVRGAAVKTTFAQGKQIDQRGHRPVRVPYSPDDVCFHVSIRRSYYSSWRKDHRRTSRINRTPSQNPLLPSLLFVSLSLTGFGLLADALLDRNSEDGVL